MSVPFRLATVTLCVLVPLAAGQEGDVKKEKAADFARPALLVAGKDYLVHAVPRLLPVTRGPEKAPKTYTELDLAKPGAAGYALLYTKPSTGQTRTLLVSGGWSAQSPPMGIDRVFHGRTRIVGTAVDSARLYVACRHSGKIVMVQAAPGEGLERSEGGYRLYVFGLADGKELHRRDLKDGDFPKEVPAETLERGPLRVVRDGVVRCFGKEHAFADR